MTATSGFVPSTPEQVAMPGVPALDEALRQACGADSSPHVTALHRLKRNVYRAEVHGGGHIRSLVLKGSDPALAYHNLLVARRWLPAVGMSHAAARLVGTVADRRGEHVWLLYEDLGDSSLEQTPCDRRRTGVAVDLAAELHLRSSGNPILPECRVHGGDLGAAYLSANLSDAINGLERLSPPRVTLTPERQIVRDRLLARLCILQNELTARIAMLAAAGGPEVLLHGDLWRTNVFVHDAPDGRGPRARFVDWDHAGVGPVCYDLSTLLLRFPTAERHWILERYREAVAQAGWRLPAAPDLNRLFATAEYARYANRVVWPVVALLVDRAEWAFDELAMVAGWFDSFAPVLPE